MKYFFAQDDIGKNLTDKVNEFLAEHPSIVIYSHQFATCGTVGFNKYVSIFYDEAPDYLTIKNKNNDKGTEGSL